MTDIPYSIILLYLPFIALHVIRAGHALLPPDTVPISEQSATHEDSQPEDQHSLDNVLFPPGAALSPPIVMLARDMGRERRLTNSITKNGTTNPQTHFQNWNILY